MAIFHHHPAYFCILCSVYIPYIHPFYSETHYDNENKKLKMGLLEWQEFSVNKNNRNFIECCN